MGQVAVRSFRGIRLSRRQSVPDVPLRAELRRRPTPIEFGAEFLHRLAGPRIETVRGFLLFSFQIKSQNLLKNCRRTLWDA